MFRVGLLTRVKTLIMERLDGQHDYCDDYYIAYSSIIPFLLSVLMLHLMANTFCITPLISVVILETLSNLGHGWI